MNDDIVKEVTNLIKEIRQLHARGVDLSDKTTEDGERLETCIHNFEGVVEENIDFLCKRLDTRWLVSIMDTYADCGVGYECDNAMMASILVTMEKVSASFINAKGGTVQGMFYTGKRFDLWDGMKSIDILKADITNNMFKRLRRKMKRTPHIEKIYDAILRRMKDGDTILSGINGVHGHIFDENTNWKDETH
jgi:hypothetical protein